MGIFAIRFVKEQTYPCFPDLSGRFRPSKDFQLQERAFMAGSREPPENSLRAVFPVFRFAGTFLTRSSGFAHE